MSQEATAMLLTLPVEMLHRIFDEIDGTTILFSVRNVCQQLRTATSSYVLYTLDFASLSKPDFRQMLLEVRPERVTTLSLSDENIRAKQIGAFLSLVDIRLFTRLCSLTLLNIRSTLLTKFFQHATRCPLTSLTLRIHFEGFTPAENQRFIEGLWSIIAQPSFVRLELLNFDLAVLIDQLQWPSQCKLQCLKVECYSQLQVSKILKCSPDLKKLVLHYESEGIQSIPTGSEEESFPLYPQLTSLTIS